MVDLPALGPYRQRALLPGSQLDKAPSVQALIDSAAALGPESQLQAPNAPDASAALNQGGANTLKGQTFEVMAALHRVSLLCYFPKMMPSKHISGTLLCLRKVIVNILATMAMFYIACAILTCFLTMLQVVIDSMHPRSGCLFLREHWTIEQQPQGDGDRAEPANQEEDTAASSLPLPQVCTCVYAASNNRFCTSCSRTPSAAFQEGKRKEGGFLPYDRFPIIHCFKS